MALRNFFAGLDNLFAKKQIPEAEQYLKDNFELAQKAEDTNYKLAVLNEQVGYYRSLGRFAESLAAGSQAMAIVSAPEFTILTSAATTMLNVATVLRAAGETSEALELYKQVDQLYSAHLDPGDRRRAALYNNMAQAMAEAGDIKTALEHLHESLDILKISDSNYVEVAITHSNIASVYMNEKELELAEAHLKESMAIFESLDYDDAHFPATLAAMARLMYAKGEYSSAAEHYNRALHKTEEIFGHNIDYARICRNCAQLYSLMGMSKEADELIKNAQTVEERLNSLNGQMRKGD